MNKMLLSFGLATALLLASGCPNGENGKDVIEDGAAASEVDVGQDVDWPVCTPGTVKACKVEGGKQALICNKWGTAFEEGICHGIDGGETICLDGQCTACLPNAQACEGDLWVLKCNPEGTQYSRHLECDTANGQICINNACQSLCEYNYKANSYIGCDYWAVDLDNAFVPARNGYYDAAGAQFAVVVANPPGSPVQAIVSINRKEGGKVEAVPYDSFGTPLPLEPLQPGELRVYKLPRRDVNGTVVVPLAYQIQSTTPIIAYQFNPLEDEEVYSNDASLLLPATLVGRDYLVMTREQTHDILRSYLTVVAVAEGTTRVSVDVTAPTLPGYKYPMTPDEEEIPHLEPGDSMEFELEKFDVLNIETDRPGADLTGSRVRADKRIAVFGGSEAANAPNTAACIAIDPLTGFGVCETSQDITCKSMADCVAADLESCCADHLEQQLFPISVWGKRYIATKSFDRGVEPDVWRILASEDNTQVAITPSQLGVTVPLLQRGEWFEFESRNHFEVECINDKPFLLGKFLATQEATGLAVMDKGGDPAFMLSIPVIQYRQDFVILVPEQYATNYLNITAPGEAEVLLDDALLPPETAEPVGMSGYVVYRLELTEAGAHTILSSEPAGVMVYGYDKHVSYGYTGGLTLEPVNEEEALDP